QLIETTTKLLTSYQIFLNQARENAQAQINAKETQAITNINEAIGQPKEQAKNEISGAKKPIIIKTLIFLRLNKAC
ncbi:hypothetical protein ACLF82_07025, partial [Helicobacter pylori]